MFHNFESVWAHLLFFFLISGWPWDLELCKEGIFFNSPFISVCISHYQSPVQPTSLSKLGGSTRNQHNSFQNVFFCKKYEKERSVAVKF